MADDTTNDRSHIGDILEGATSFLQGLIEGIRGLHWPGNARTNVHNDTESVTISVLLPGATRDAVKVRGHADYVEVTVGARARPKNHVRQEFEYAPGLVKVPYPPGVDRNPAAKMEGGILTLRFTRQPVKEDIPLG